LNHLVIVIAFESTQSDPIKRRTLYFNVAYISFNFYEHGSHDGGKPLEKTKKKSYQFLKKSSSTKFFLFFAQKNTNSHSFILLLKVLLNLRDVNEWIRCRKEIDKKIANTEKKMLIKSLKTAEGETLSETKEILSTKRTLDQVEANAFGHFITRIQSY
jgi:hypothetical protein